MTVKELIERLNKIEDKQKTIYVFLTSPYEQDYSLETENIKIEEDTYDIFITGKNN